jgi:hypothetical protein
MNTQIAKEKYFTLSMELNGILPIQKDLCRQLESIMENGGTPQSKHIEILANATQRILEIHKEIDEIFNSLDG